uniref:LacI family transcriptional regulator n=1 Tax=Gracilinema caldarium TaxID=215591 RepID=A0A7C3IJK0_9SPIR
MTIQEIALEAGVSTATVSRVINNQPVSKEKRELVEGAIRRLNYLPDDLTRRHLGTPYKAVAVLTHSMTNPYSMEFVETIIDRYEELGINVYVSRNETADIEYRCLADLLARGVEGIILHDPPFKNYETGLFTKISERLPLVIVHSFNQVLEMNEVVVDQYYGMKKVMSHLIGLGHRDILFLRNKIGYSLDLKEKVWREELTLAGTPPKDNYVLVIPDADKEAGIKETEDIVRQFFASNKRPTAIFAANDMMGVGALNVIKELGLRVPEDISVISHDNTMLAASYHLSSVDLKIKSVAHAVVDLMQYVVNGHDKEPRRIMITPELILRGSTAKIG